ncbi:MAG: hypothetical protein H6672_00610 [Anaerolineaceae bacterium]|nr:hypothetical protein [Anaerolineaceae bacterium]
MVIYLAQTSISFDQIIAALGPRSGIDLVWDIMLYLIFFLAFISMLRGSDKQVLPTILMAIVAGSAVIAKLNILNPKASGNVGSEGVLLLIINASMFFLPLIVVGIADKKSKARPTAIIGAVIGAVYFFGFWFVVMRG